MMRIPFAKLTLFVAAEGLTGAAVVLLGAVGT